jgi:hypothetical protein
MMIDAGPMQEHKTVKAHRRGSDVIRVEYVTAWDACRRYVIIGSWFGHVLMVVYGVFFGLSYGGFGGIQFFTNMFMLEHTGMVAAVLGLILGTFIGLVCVWAICVIFASFLGLVFYWLRFRSFPTPPE